MELEFKQSSMPYLKCVLQEMKYQEESGETIVPDSYPDIGSIIHTYADAILRGKDCRNGSITVSGGIKGGILYEPEDHSSPRMLELYLPFTVKAEHPDLRESDQNICHVHVRSVDGRMINSRKAMLRVELSCSICAYTAAEETLYALEEKPDTLQVLEQTYPLCIPLAVAEKSFVVSDNLEIPMNKAPVSAVCKFTCRPYISEKKLVGNRGVFKGAVCCKLLYVGDDQNYFVHEQEIPFSQYCEYAQDLTEHLLDISPVITGCDLEQQWHEEGRRASVTVNVLVQSRVLGKNTVTVAEDAYSTAEQFDPQWTNYHIATILDRRSDTLPVHQHMKYAMSEIVDCDLYWGHPVFLRKNQELHMEVPVCFQVFGLDENRQPCSTAGKTDISQTYALAEDSTCIANISALGPCYANLSHGGVDVRCDLLCECEFCTEQALQTLSGGSVETESSASQHAASVILKKLPKGTKVWDIAKSYRSREEEILCANHLTEPYLTEDRTVLIPVG